MESITGVLTSAPGLQRNGVTLKKNMEIFIKVYL